MATEGLQFSAWHPLLVRTLKLVLEDAKLLSGCRSGTLLAVLVRIPIPPESVPYFDQVLRLLGQYINSISVTEALRSTCYVACQYPEDLVYLTGTSKTVTVRKPSSRRASLRNTKRRSTGTTQPDSDTDRAPFHKLKSVSSHIYCHNVQINERVLLSDSDGFAFWKSEDPSLEEETVRSFIKDNSLYTIYKSLYGKYPTFFSPLDTLINSIIVYSKFSSKCSIQNGLAFLCDYFDNCAHVVLNENSRSSKPVFRQWSHWQSILKQGCRCISFLARYSTTAVGCHSPSSFSRVISILLDLFGRNICAAVRLNSFIQSLEVCDETNFGSIDDALRTTHKVSLNLFDDILTLIVYSQDFSFLSRLGDYIVSWTEDPLFVQIIPTILKKVERELGLSRPTVNTTYVRFAFELFASLVDMPGVTEDLFKWALSLPAGFKKAVTGTELLAAVSSQSTNFPDKCSALFKKHLPVMYWSSPERSSSFNGILSSDTLPSEAVIRFTQDILYNVRHDTLVMLCTYLLPYCDPFDTEYLIINAIVPDIYNNCQAVSQKQQDLISTDEMSPQMKEILKGLELLAAHLRTTDASTDVIKKIVCPYREFYFAASELQDVFVAVCARSVRYSPAVAQESGICEWMVDRLSSLRAASADIWLFVEDSASKFSKLLISMLNLICDVVEEGTTVFNNQADKLRNNTNLLVDICFEWLGNASTNYRSIVRISEMISKALSIYLILSVDVNDVVARFSSALLRSLGDHPPDILLSVLSCSLLDRCISRHPSPIGSLLSIENDSEDDQLMGEGGPLASTPIRKVLHPQLVPAVLIIVTTILKKREAAGMELEFMVTKIVKRLQQIDRHFQDGQRWMPQLFAFSSELLRVRVDVEAMYSVMELMTLFIKREPKSKYIHEIMRYYNECLEYKEILLDALNILLNGETAQPASCLVFPQPMIKQEEKTEITTMEQMEAVFRREYSEELEKSIQTERLEAADKYLANRSDGETETERRREKKKHLRDHLRGQSMAGIDQSNKSDGSSPSPAVDTSARDCAASILLNEPNYISSYDGLTLSFWLKRKAPTRMISKLPPLHVASLGGEELTVTCWLTSKGRLFVEIYSKEYIFAKIRLKGQITDNSWTHVTYGMRLTAEYVCIQVTVGHEFISKEVPLLVKINNPTFPLTVSFGSIQKRQSGDYRISTIFSFKGILPYSCVLTLCALGCRLSSLSETKMDTLMANLGAITMAKMVISKQHIVEMVRQDPLKFVRKVQRAVVFVIRANQALKYGISVLPHGLEPTSIIGQPPLRMACLKFFPINWKGGRIQEFHTCPKDSIRSLGGVRFLAYLYPKAVNDSLPASVQLKALQLLLASVSNGVSFENEVHDLRLELLLTRVLSCPAAAVTDQIVDTLLRFCIEFTVWNNETEMEGSSETLEEIDSYHAVIREPELLVSICCRYEIWQGERFPFWRKVVHSIASVLDPDVCALTHSFNKNQLVEVDMLPKFLHCVQEMIGNIDDFHDFEEQQFVGDVRAIVQCLLGCPETPQTVTQLWHFVFLTHPANDAYIEHRVQGHTSWIIPELFRDGPEGELLGDSPLAQRLRQYNTILGEDYLKSAWRNSVSPYEIRKTFEEMSASLDDEEERRPTLLSDLPASNSSSDSALELEAREEHRSEKSHPTWVVAIRAAMMDILAATLQNGADSLLACLLHDAISWHAIVILMSHQSDKRVRDAVCDMLQKFLLRCPPFTKIVFLRLQGFKILATQLRAYPPTQEIADFLFSMMCGETIRLGDGLDQTHLTNMKVDRLSCESLHAILVIFENSITDVALFWNVSNAILKTFENNSQLQQALLDCGLIDAMVATLRKIAFHTAPSSNLYEIVLDKPSHSPQLECWSNLAQRIIISGIPYSDPVLTKSCERFIWLLQLADIQAAKDTRYPEDKRYQGHKAIRAQLCQLLHCWMESIRVVFSEEGRSASATSSVDSLYRDAESSSSSPSTEMDFDYCDDAITPEKANLLDGTSPVAAFFAGSFANLRKRISSMGPISRKALRCPYNRKMGPAPLANTENLLERIVFALDVISAISSIFIPTIEVTEEEENLFHFYLYFLLTSWKREKEGSRSAGQTVWNRLIVLCRDKVRIHLAQIVAFVLFPAQRKLYDNTIASNPSFPVYPTWKSEWVEEKRRQVVRALSHELQYRQSLTSILSVNLDYEYALCLGLYDLAFLSEVKPEFESDLTMMIKFLTSGKMGPTVDGFSPETLSNMTTDEILSLHCFSQHRKGVMAQLRSKMEVFRDMEEKLTAEIGMVAMEVTREVAEQMNLPRKIFMRTSKQAIAKAVEAENALTAIAKEICHPEAIGFEKRHWPVGWALDPTEGPMRERRRLIPYQYPFEPRFISEEKRGQITSVVYESPFQNLFNGEEGKSRRSFHDVAQLDEHIRLFLDATVLRGTFECQGELHIGETRLHFIGETAKSTQKGSSCDVITISWSYDQLVEVQMRNHLLKDVALEVFLSNGETYLIVFLSTERRGQFVKQLRELGQEHLFPNTSQLVQAVVQSWRHGALSNFEYLMQLNKLAGRSFNDLMQYPVFPFVLSDYTSSVLDLSSSSSYRNLQKPMAIQDKRMESHYVANYNCLQAECSRDLDGGPLHFGPYHYGSHYSNSGIVAHYLVRLSPFTQIALEYQDNNFDIPDRLFNSIEATWRLSSCESTTDFKELIPEFFCLGEFLVNREGLDLGIRQAGDKVGSVRLPTWTPANNPRLFTLIHRQALEALTVTQNLHSWVDLIFGFKQTGKPALDAINVFHPATYLGRLNVDEVLDELSQSALRTMVKSYGQMPIQILQTPHQPHLYAGKEKKDKDKEREREKERPPAPIPSVVGVRWGDYVGSPEQDVSQINVTLSVKGLKSDRLGSVVALVDGNVAGCTRDTVLISLSAPENPSDLLCKTKVQTSLAAISWLFSDSVLRFRLIQPEVQPWINLLDYHGSKISKVSYSATNRLLFVAFTSGLIRVFHLLFNEKGLQSITFRSDLLAHHFSVDCLCICDEFSTVVSGDADGKVVVWDTNRLSFVRVLRNPSHPVSSICISSTSADIVVVSQQGYGSRVELFTVNGDLVGSVGTDTPVMSVAMTNQPEGCAINCMALGMQDGHIRLVEMWCLTVVRDIWHEKDQEPIISVTFASSGRKLFALLSSGRVLCWQSLATLTKSRAPPFAIINPHDM